MPLFEYLLLAFIGSGGAAGSDAPANINPPQALSADAIVQPNGGVTSTGLPQVIIWKKGRHSKTLARQSRRHRRHRNRIKLTQKSR